jgi:hypothetical protein
LRRLQLKKGKKIIFAWKEGMYSELEINEKDLLRKKLGHTKAYLSACRFAANL